MIVKWHKLGNQDVFSTPGLEIQLGDLKPSQTEEIEVDDETAQKLLEQSNQFTLKGGELIDKEPEKK